MEALGLISSELEQSLCFSVPLERVVCLANIVNVPESLPSKSLQRFNCI